MEFLDHKYGSALLPESSLELLDRSLSFGDVVKRESSDSMSGTIVHTSISCTLRLGFTGDRLEQALRLLYPTNEAKVYSEKSAIENCKLLDVPGEELKYEEEYHEGDLIIYNGWVGQIMEAFDEVTIRLGNESVVIVEDSEELDMDPVTSPYDHPPLDKCYVGQHVSTKKGNLRRGRWKYGEYDPSVPPKGQIMDVRIVALDVRWMTRNVLAPGRYEFRPQPPSLLDLDVLESEEVILYNRGKSPASSSNAQFRLGFTTGSDIAVGDYVRFRDITGAAVKYDGTGSTRKGSCQGQLRKIPRVATLGYDMNVFQVIGTETQVSVLWQDLSLTQENSADLLPYLNVDDHDVWPGEIVALKKSGLAPPSDSVLRPDRIGVVQSVDAGERMAHIRWYKDSRVELAGEARSILIPGSRLGELSDEMEDVSFYEFIAYPALTKRRGDMVLVAPEQLPQLNGLGAEITKMASSRNESVPNSTPDQFSSASARNGQMERGLFRSLLSRFTGFPDSEVQRHSIVVDGSSPSESQPYNDGGSTSVERGSHKPPGLVDWFGEVVDLGLDGLLTVRLGGLEEVRDIRVSLERVVVVVGGDDEDEPYGTDEDWDDDDSDDSPSSGYHSEGVLEETYEYEGGERLDGDDNDEMWTTDDDGVTDSISGPDTSTPREARSSDEFHTKASTASSNKDGQDSVAVDITQATSESTTSPQAALEPLASEPLFSTYPSCPSPFMILDADAPSDHHFLNQTVDLPASRMRRIQKEHKILRSSLPDGIFVRTWESRLDLLRVLIVGPRSTPYERAPFVMDFQFGPSFPSSSPDAFFHSWTGGIGRVNPNLYEDGKICLSLLGTWPADARNEGWSATRSSMLQVLVSLMGLVLVKEPYYNEAGFDALIGTEESQITSALYTERALVMSKGFVRHALQYPVGAFEDVVSWLYLPADGDRPRLLLKVLEESKEIIRLSDAKSEKTSAEDSGLVGFSSTAPVRKISSGALVLLRKHVAALEDFLAAYNASR